MHSDSPKNRSLLLGLAAIAVIVAELAAVLILEFSSAIGIPSPIAGDPGLYNTIVSAIFAGDVPYFELPVEHLPGALIPMIAVKFASNLFGLGFEVLWPVAMGTVFIASVWLADQLPTTVNSGRRFLLLSLPTLPLVLFRVEPWLILWVLISIVLAFRGSWPAQSAATFVAAMIKGWPIILFVLPFRRAHKTLAIAFGAVTALLLATVAVLPGFQQARAFDGIQVETFVGSLMLVVRWATGTDLHLISAAGATYTAAPMIAVVANGFIGLPFLVISGVMMLRTRDVARLVQLAGLGVVGIMLASPLFSAQFVYWIVPFAIFAIPRIRRTYVAAALLTLLTIAMWDPFSALWSSTVFIRNILILLLAVMWTYSLAISVTTERQQRSSEHVA